jgi:hypothetical protein
MKCPKCGFVQPQNSECVNCGIFVARYKPEDERVRPPAPVASGEAAAAQGTQDPFMRPIRPSLRVVRTVAGMVGLLFGGWLFVAGQHLDLKPLNVFFLIAYGCISLFWILSAPIRVPVKQFAIEMLIFVSATLLLRVALPEAFELGTLSNRQAGPLNVGLSGPGGTSRVLTPGGFLNSMDVLASSARELLDEPSDPDSAQEWFARCQRAREFFRKLERGDRKKCESLYKSMVTLETRMEKVTVSDPPLGSLEDAFIAVEFLEKEIAGSSL